MPKLAVVLSTIILFSACTQPRIKKYQSLLEPKIGNSKKDEINKILGSPAWCTTEAGTEKCEYRTAHANNEPVPDMYRKEDSLGPDLSPYDRFDVLHVFYDSTGVFKDWEPVVFGN